VSSGEYRGEGEETPEDRINRIMKRAKLLRSAPAHSAARLTLR
jgi:hypothetical protein